MKFQKEMSVVSKLSLMERFILVHSMLYYEYNTNIIEDYVYDKEQSILAKAIKRFPDEFKKSRYYKTFKTFTGSTGFDLNSRCKRLQPEEYDKICYIAEMVYNENTRRNQEVLSKKRKKNSSAIRV